MRAVCLLMLCCVGFFSAQAQVVFPQSHFGVWQGTLYASTTGARQPQKIPMKLTIDSIPGRASRYAFYIKYGDQPPRNYELVIVDAAKGVCQIDQKDGVLLTATQMGNRIVSQFSVGESLITTTYTFANRKIEFDLVFTTTRTTRTGPTAQPVLVHAATTYQHADLTREGEK